MSGEDKMALMPSQCVTHAQASAMITTAARMSWLT